RTPDDSVLVSLPLSVVAPAALSHDVRVVFRADFNASYLPAGAAVAALLDGSTSFPLADNGIAPDAVAGDRGYTGQRVFASGSEPRHRYLFTMNGAPECDTTTAGDRRVFSVDPAYDNAANPQLLPVGLFAQCSTTGVEPPLVRPLTTILFQNAPNPFRFLT